MKFLFPTLSLGAVAVLAGLAGPALADTPSSAHSMMQIGQRHQNSATETDYPAAGFSNAPSSAHSMMQAGQRHQNNAAVQAAQDVTGNPKLGFNEALQVALKVQPGSVANEELENEPGGSGLRYSFDIKSGVDTHEVGVDAMTGVVLENSVEGPNPD